MSGQYGLMDIGCTVTIIARPETAGTPVVLRAEVRLTHEPLDPEDPRQPDDVTITYDKIGGGELAYLSTTLDVLAGVLRDSQP